MEKEMAEDLIPGLPQEVARECLIRVPYDRLPAARSVCRGWRRELGSAAYHRLRKRAGSARPILALAQAEREPSSPSLSGPAHKYGAAPLSSAYGVSLFDPSAGSWAKLPPIPGVPRGLPLFCRLAAVGTQLVVLGGWDPDTWAPSDAVHVYDFLSGAWRRGAPIPGPRRSFFACAAAPLESTVYVAGGHDEEKNALRSALAYDAAADEWAPLPDMARERDEPRGVLLRGRFCVVGGYATEAQGRFGRSAEAFDPAARAWAPVDEHALDEPACPRTCAADVSGRMYMVRAPGGHVAVREGDAWRVAAEVPEEARVVGAVVAAGRGGWWWGLRARARAPRRGTLRLRLGGGGGGETEQ
uniref:F-box domain-containing protein n=1 Tax=Ananas comosus var. bracteatus TaxID=296719 RepID=A0A6V7QJI0_ANACO|nr:unnamed protein product [Ananas comosus var. bracteatus]